MKNELNCLLCPFIPRVAWELRVVSYSFPRQLKLISFFSFINTLNKPITHSSINQSNKKTNQINWKTKEEKRVSEWDGMESSWGTEHITNCPLIQLKELIEGPAEDNHSIHSAHSTNQKSLIDWLAALDSIPGEI